MSSTIRGEPISFSSWAIPIALGAHPPSHHPSPHGVIDSLLITSVQPNDYHLLNNNHYTSDGVHILQDHNSNSFFLPMLNFSALTLSSLKVNNWRVSTMLSNLNGRVLGVCTIMLVVHFGECNG
jgi:hypothetical protein